MVQDVVAMAADYPDYNLDHSVVASKEAHDSMIRDEVRQLAIS